MHRRALARASALRGNSSPPISTVSVLRSSCTEYSRAVRTCTPLGWGVCLHKWWPLMVPRLWKRGRSRCLAAWRVRARTRRAVSSPLRRVDTSQTPLRALSHRRQPPPPRHAHAHAHACAARPPARALEISLSLARSLVRAHTLARSHAQPSPGPLINRGHYLRVAAIDALCARRARARTQLRTRALS